jgi:arabinoxylan arabinofuranohydrolase
MNIKKLSIAASLVLASVLIVSCGSHKGGSKEEVVDLQMPHNPFITTMYLADPSARVWDDGRLYVYPSHDIDPPRGCDLMDHYHVFSTDDMVNWKDHGEILCADDVPWGRKEGGFMWAPDCAYKNGTYYYYFPHPSGTDWNNTWKVGIATSKYPDRDFKVQGYLEGLGDPFAMIDPCVFIDDDGQAYFYYGGGGRMIGVKLKENMTEIDGEVKTMTGMKDYHEGPWIFKKDSKYYLMYADNHVEPGNRAANRLNYCWSDNPLGPWEYKGIVLGPTDCDTSHGSIVKYKGHWYLFYHNCSISHQGNLRSICVDKLYFNDDGTIQTVTQTK